VTNTLVVIGQGYVGLPMALRAAETGMTVVGLDSNPVVVDQLNAGTSHIDDVSQEELAAGLRAGFSASGDPAVIADADVVVVCVPTPLAEEGGPDLAPVRAAAAAIGRHIRPGTLCILESTTYPGTTEEVFAPLVCGEHLEPGRDVFIAFSPERIDPGNETFGVRNTPKVVGGLTPECGRRAREFYGQFVDTVVQAKRAREAEMAKLLENTFRHVNIALVNELAMFARRPGHRHLGGHRRRREQAVRVHGVPARTRAWAATACRSTPRTCRWRVKRSLGQTFRFVELANEINTATPLYVADRVRALLNDDRKAANGAKVLLLGVTYKANVSDQRESPAEPLAKRLLLWGADLSYHDALVPKWDVTAPGGRVTLSCVPDLEASVAGADIVVLLQNHAEYDVDALGALSTLLLDTRGRVKETESVFRL
jgi:UDP-N-acetyl-D-glucosamine dehydrogenase